MLELTTFDEISLPFLTTAAAVSSHEVSIPRTYIIFLKLDDLFYQIRHKHELIAFLGNFGQFFF